MSRVRAIVVLNTFKLENIIRRPASGPAVATSTGGDGGWCATTTQSGLAMQTAQNARHQRKLHWPVTWRICKPPPVKGREAFRMYCSGRPQNNLGITFCNTRSLHGNFCRLSAYRRTPQTSPCWNTLLPERSSQASWYTPTVVRQQRCIKLQINKSLDQFVQQQQHSQRK